MFQFWAITPVEHLLVYIEFEFKYLLESVIHNCIYDFAERVQRIIFIKILIRLAQACPYCYDLYLCVFQFWAIICIYDFAARALSIFLLNIL